MSNFGSWGNQAAFDNAVRAARQVAQDEARKIVAKTAQELAARVQSATPLGDPKHGHIRESVEAVQVDADTWKVTIGGSSQPYAAALEFGHAAGINGDRVPPQKVFFPSVRIMNRKFGRAIRRALRKAIRNGGLI